MKATVILFIFPIGLLFAQERSSFSHHELFDVNNISAYVWNNGLLHEDRDSAGSTPGFEWPKGSGKHLIWGSLPWLAAKTHGEIRIAGGEGYPTFNPGPMDATTHRPADPRDSTFRVCKIQRGDSTSWDYIHWLGSLGAPTRGDGKPHLLGDQTLWCVFNCADSTSPYDYSRPLALEIQQTVFGYNSLGELLNNLMIVRYLIVNKSTNLLDSMYFGLWSDPNLGDPADDRSGCDSAQSLWYSYNATDSDAVYGLHPPAVGYAILQGPMVTSGPDSALFMGRHRSGYKNLPMTSFVMWPNEFWSNPRTASSVYSYFQARWWYWDRHITYGGFGTDTTAPPTNFMYTGDPETGAGWLSEFSRHQFGASGPFTMAPGDTQEVVMGFLVSEGASNTNSVTKLKNEIRGLMDMYRQILYTELAPPGPDVHPSPEIPELYSLSYNYPNPFNPGTQIQFGLPIDANITLSVYNALGQRVVTLASGFYPAGTYTVKWEPKSAATGVYVYQLEAGRYVKSRRMLLVR